MVRDPRLLTDLDTESVVKLGYLLVPLAEGSTLKNSVIFCVVVGLVGGWRICAQGDQVLEDFTLHLLVASAKTLVNQLIFFTCL